MEGYRCQAVSKRPNQEQGFTLMELVVAVFVISVLIAVTMPHLLGASQRAETTACEENQRTIRAALTEYYLLYHTYPSGNSMQQLQTLVSQQLLESIPKDPGGGNYVISDADANNVVVSCDVHGILGNDQ
jgi:prepilin-type N-terminal cleavage/methylation domain-containing protein